MREKILNILKDGLEYSANDLKQQLDLTSSKEFVELIKCLNKMIDDGLIFLNEHNKYEYINDEELFKGNLIVKRNGKCFVIFRSEMIEVNNAGRFNVLDNDEILFRIFGHQASIVKITKHNLVYVVGIIRIRRGRKYFYADDSSFPKGYKIVNFEQFNLKDSQKVRCYISNYDKKELKIEMIIGNAYSSEVRELSILYSQDIPLEFSSTCLNEANSFNDDIEIQNYPNRHDCTNEMIITIDGDEAKDFDDAISLTENKLGNYILKVHIADVGEYVKVSSAIDKEALNRGTSIYYPAHVIPMLPNTLSDGLCSLQSNKNRLAMTVEAEYDKNGQCIRYEIYESVIKSKYRMTYNNVNKIYDHDGKLLEQYNEIVDMLMKCKILADKINKLSAEKGSIDFNSDDCQIILNKKGKVVDIKPVHPGIAEGIIECFMIEANKIVASHMHVLEYPMIYRNHDRPKEDKIAVFYNLAESLGYHFKGKKQQIYPKQLQDCLDSFKDSPEYPIMSTFLLRSMAKAVYQSECIGHFGLGLENYCHFTSPIRRYPDLQVHRMLKKYVINIPDYSAMEKDNENNILIAKRSSQREVIATKVERDIVDLKKCEYMSEHINEYFSGVISSTTSFGFYVKLENTIEGLVHVKTLDGFYNLTDDGTLLSDKHSFKIGQIVKVQCINVDLLKLDIDFCLAKDKKLSSTQMVKKTKKCYNKKVKRR